MKAFHSSKAVSVEDGAIKYEILAPGVFLASKGGLIEITQDDVDACYANTTALLSSGRLTIPNKLGHGEDQDKVRSLFPKEGAPALGWNDRLEMTSDGRIVAHGTRLSRGFLKRIADGRWRNRSAEIDMDYPDGSGGTISHVISAVAWLGETPPAITHMRDAVVSLSLGSTLPTLNEAHELHLAKSGPGQRYRHGWIPIGGSAPSDGRSSDGPDSEPDADLDELKGRAAELRKRAADAYHKLGGDLSNESSYGFREEGEAARGPNAADHVTNRIHRALNADTSIHADAKSGLDELEKMLERVTTEHGSAASGATRHNLGRILGSLDSFATRDIKGDHARIVQSTKKREGGATRAKRGERRVSRVSRLVDFSGKHGAGQRYTHGWVPIGGASSGSGGGSDEADNHKKRMGEHARAVKSRFESLAKDAEKRLASAGKDGESTQMGMDTLLGSRHYDIHKRLNADTSSRDDAQSALDDLATEETRLHSLVHTGSPSSARSALNHLRKYVKSLESFDGRDFEADAARIAKKPAPSSGRPKKGGGDKMRLSRLDFWGNRGTYRHGWIPIGGGTPAPAGSTSVPKSARSPEDRAAAVEEKKRNGALGRTAPKTIFKQEVEKINKLVSELQELSKSNLGYNAENVNWGHVGTAMHLVSSIEQLLKSHRESLERTGP